MDPTTTTLVETELDLIRPYAFEEQYDTEVMDYILSHPDSYSKRDIQCLGRYKKSRHNGNFVKVNYERGGKAAQAKGIGRLYPRDGLGLQGFRPCSLEGRAGDQVLHEGRAAAARC
jgi:hypothetical protein